MLNVQNCGHAWLRQCSSSNQPTEETPELSALDLLFIGAIQLVSYYNNIEVYLESEERKKLFEVAEKLINLGVRFTRWFHMGFDLIERREWKVVAYAEHESTSISSHEILMRLISSMLERAIWHENFVQSKLIRFLRALIHAGIANSIVATRLGIYIGGVSKLRISKQRVSKQRVSKSYSTRALQNLL